jgi:A118 family predicted phage portal protein
MPLPVSDTVNAWPPVYLVPILTKMNQWSAWYTGDIEKLQAAYGGGTASNDVTGFFASDHGGFKATVGRTMQRWFVAQRPLGAERNTKLPIPIAAEMCQASADLLFADPATVTVTDEATQDRLNDLMDDGLHSTLAEAAEVCAALGGVYLLVSWDPAVVPDAPFVTIKDADQAIPEFKWGRLQAVTFWSVVHTEGKVVYRHLERHELRNGVGFIVHGLYMGETDRLGTRVSLETIPATAALTANPDMQMDGSLSTESPGLDVVYIPNQTPNRIWRTDPIGRHLGRSDLDGVEHLMDQLAETMSDWMRARRVARARIMMAKNLLKNAGPGQGSVANLDQELFTELPGMLGGAAMPLADQIQVLEPTFNFLQYQSTAQALVEQILQMAGYSMQTFGVGDTGTVRTATEIESKERRSLMTRARKIREWTPGIVQLLIKLMAVDMAIFGNPSNTTDLSVEFSDGVQETQLALANTALALYQSESASTEERVAILHPDWDDEDVMAEVALIKAEFAHPLPDPAMSPFDGGTTNDGSNPFNDTSAVK